MKRKAYKNPKCPAPITAIYLNNNKVVFSSIVEGGPVKIDNNTEATLVRISHKVDIADPSTDIIAKIGKAQVFRRSGVPDPSAPSIWYWKDRLMMLAVDSEGSDYYHKQYHLLYEINIVDQEEFFQGLDWNHGL